MPYKSIAKWALSKSLGKDASQLSFGDKQYVTFDIFDTLIKRSCGKPERVFHLVDCAAKQNRLLGSEDAFVEMRRRAELEARRIAGPNNEVTLEDIYRRMHLISHGTRQSLMEIELACEFVVCEPNEEVVARYNDARSSCKTAIISDTYLPLWFIKNVLDSCGIRGYDRLYVSSSYGVMKRNGRLFDCVLNDFGVGAAEVLHVGDHPLADYYSPKKKGMSAFLIRSNN